MWSTTDTVATVAAAAQVSAAVFTGVMAKRTHDLAKKTGSVATAANREAQPVVDQGVILERQADAMAALADAARKDRTDRLQAERADQARRISAYLTTDRGNPLVQLHVINASIAQVTRFQTVAIAHDFSGPGVSWKGSFFLIDETVIIEPGGTTRPGSVIAPIGLLTFRHEIAFDDDNGVSWHKYGSEGLHEVPADFTLLTNLQWDPSQRQGRP
jgi:hypothetical protein